MRDSYVHDLNKLVLLAGLEADRKNESDTNPEFETNWRIVRRWTEASRYSIIDQASAKEMIDAISDKKHGVLKWLIRYW